MKKLKHSLLALFIFTSLSASAQFSFSVKGGLNVSNASMSLPEMKINPKTKVGFNIGAFGEYMLDSHMGLQAGLQFMTKGTKFSSSKDEKTVIKMNVIQLPVHFLYKIEIADELNISLHAGPYASYAVTGKSTDLTDKDGKKTTEETDMYGKASEFNYGRFDLGVGFGIGFEFGNILADIGYDLGIIDLIKDTNAAKGTFRANNIYVSAGYRF